MFLFILSLISASAEFPICTASGDQLYPDVCWDGEAFWVVWQDEGTIRGIRVSEQGEFLTDEVELLNSDTFRGPVCHSAVAAGPDRIFVEARVMLFYNEFGSKTWGIMHNEFSFGGTPILPYPWVLPRGSGYDKEAIHASTPCILFGEKYFFSFHRYSKETPIDFHASSVAWGFDFKEGKAYPMWKSSEVQLEFYPPVVCWDGERFVMLYWDALDQIQKGAFFSDSIYYKEIGEDFSWPWGIIEIPTDDLRFETKFQTLAPGKTGYFFISQTCEGYVGVDYVHGMVFYILDSTVMPVDSGKTVGFFPNITCYYPDAVFNGKTFICVWENRHDEGGTDLYSIEVDTLGNVIDSGYIVEGADTAQHPAMIRGPFKILMVWADNRDGNFNIYGSFLDAVGVEEPATQQLTHLPTITVDQTVFTDVLKINLSAAAAGGTVIIHDALGRVVRRLQVEGRSGSCVWDGRDSRGNDAGEGVYFVSLAGKTRNARLKVIKIK